MIKQINQTDPLLLMDHLRKVNRIHRLQPSTIITNLHSKTTIMYQINRSIEIIIKLKINNFD